MEKMFNKFSNNNFKLNSSSNGTHNNNNIGTNSAQNRLRNETEVYYTEDGTEIRLDSSILFDITKIFF